MLFSPEIRTQVSERDLALVRVLERIQLELGLDYLAWSEYMHLTPKDCKRVMDGHTPLSAMSLYHLSERLSLDPQVFETGKIDYVALIQAFSGNRSYINPIHQIAASSRKFTAVNTLNFVEKFRGSRIRVAANRHFQIHEDFWSDWQDSNSERINIRMLSELWAFLRMRGFKEEDFRAIGFHSFFTYKNTHIGKALSSFHHPRSSYECLFGSLIENFEENHIYKIIRLTDETCIVESRSNPDVANALSIRETGSVEGCQFKAGVFSSLPVYVDSPPASVHETHCVHRGDSMCRFFCDFTPPRAKHGTARRLSLLSGGDDSGFN